MTPPARDSGRLSILEVVSLSRVSDLVLDR